MNRQLAALAALALLGPHPPALAQAPAASRPVIAVVPLANGSGDAAQDAFADGMTDELAAALVAVGDLDVVARSSSFRFKQTADAKAIGQALHAGYLVQGSTDRSGGGVRLQVRLVEASDGTVLAAQDLFGLGEQGLTCRDRRSGVVAEIVHQGQSPHPEFEQFDGEVLGIRAHAGGRMLVQGLDLLD